MVKREAQGASFELHCEDRHLRVDHPSEGQVDGKIPGKITYPPDLGIFEDDFPLAPGGIC